MLFSVISGADISNNYSAYENKFVYIDLVSSEIRHFII